MNDRKLSNLEIVLTTNAKRLNFDWASADHQTDHPQANYCQGLTVAQSGSVANEDGLMIRGYVVAFEVLVIAAILVRRIAANMAGHSTGGHTLGLRFGFTLLCSSVGLAAPVIYGIAADRRGTPAPQLPLATTTNGSSADTPIQRSLSLFIV